MPGYKDSVELSPAQVPHVQDHPPSLSTHLTDGRPVVDLAPALLGRSRTGTPVEPGRRLGARLVHLEPGALDPGMLVDDPEGWIGLLVLDGLLVVELEAGRARTSWLMGGEDLVRPWDMAEISLTRATAWRTLTPARIALLDQDFSVRAGGIPLVARALVTSAVRTSNWLLAKTLMLASPAIEERLLLTFALLGERWGKVNREGVSLRLPLTHALLASLCGSRRPSVTIALGSLEAAGILTRTVDGGWLLRRHCDGGPRERSCWVQYTTALGLAGRTAG